MITKEKLDKMDQCRHLLDAPAPEVVGELIEEIRSIQAALETTREMLQAEETNSRNLNDWVRGVNENPTLSGRHYDTKQWVQARLGKLQAAVDAVWATWTQGAELSASVEMVRPLVTRETPECTWCGTPMHPAKNAEGGIYHYCRTSDQHGVSINGIPENAEPSHRC